MKKLKNYPVNIIFMKVVLLHGSRRWVDNIITAIHGWLCLYVQTHKEPSNYTHKNAQVVTDLQTSCNKVVVKPMSGCVRTACSQLL
jgi:hypothetical protein